MKIFLLLHIKNIKGEYNKHIIKDNLTLFSYFLTNKNEKDKQYEKDKYEIF